MKSQDDPSQVEVLIEKLRWLRLPGMAAAVKDLLECAAKDNLTKAEQAQIKALQKQVSEGQQLIKRETSIRNRWNWMQANALPANPSQAEQRFLKALDGWSREAGTELTSIMPQWKSDSTNYLTLACRVESAGDLATLSKFLYALEKGPMALKVDSVELTARDTIGQQMTLSLEINGLALVARDKK